MKIKVLIILWTSMLYANATDNLASMGLKWQTLKESIHTKEEAVLKAQQDFQDYIKEMNRHQNKLSGLISDLRKKQDFLMPLSLMQSSNMEDRVHTLILLKRIKPRFEANRKALVKRVKAYHQAKKQCTAEQEDLNVTKKELQNIESQIEDKRRTAFKGDEELENSICKAFIAKDPRTMPELVTFLQDIAPKMHNEQSIIKIHPPLRGKIQSDTDEANDNHVMITQKTMGEDYVLAPWSGFVLYAGDFNDKRTIAIRYGDMTLILRGQMDIYCKIGDIVTLGEPLARVTQTISTDMTFSIYKGQQSVDPLPFMTQKQI